MNSRVYLIGMSMGGFGTWALANRMPDRFAAISPMCGGADVNGQISLAKFQPGFSTELPTGQSDKPFRGNCKSA